MSRPLRLIVVHSLNAIVDELIGLADFLHEAQPKGGVRIDHLAGERKPVGPTGGQLANV